MKIASHYKKLSCRHWKVSNSKFKFDFSLFLPLGFIPAQSFNPPAQRSRSDLPQFCGDYRWFFRSYLVGWLRRVIERVLPLNSNVDWLWTAVLQLLYSPVRLNNSLNSRVLFRPVTKTPELINNIVSFSYSLPKSVEKNILTLSNANTVWFLPILPDLCYFWDTKGLNNPRSGSFIYIFINLFKEQVNDYLNNSDF